MGRKRAPRPPSPNPLASTAAQILGRIGGPARARTLTPERRHAIAMLGVAARRKKSGQSPLPRGAPAPLIRLGASDLALLDSGRVLTLSAGRLTIRLALDKHVAFTRKPSAPADAASKGRVKNQHIRRPPAC